MKKLRGGGICTLSRSSHLNDISWETRIVSSGRKCFNQGKKGVVPDTPFVPHLSQAGAATDYTQKEMMLNKVIFSRFSESLPRDR